MKKLISLFAALLVAAGALTVSGCATSHDDLEPVAYPSHIIGAATLGDKSDDAIDLWNTKAVPLTFDSDGIATYEFTVTKDMIANFWGAGLNNVNYKFLMDEKGSAQVGKADDSPTEGGDYVLCKSGDASIPIENVAVGNKYKVYCKVEGTKVSTKYELTSGTAATKLNIYLINSSGWQKVTELTDLNTYTAFIDATDTTTSFYIYDGTNYWNADSVTLDTATSLTEATDAKKKLVSISTTSGTCYKVSIDTSSDAYKITVVEAPYLEIAELQGSWGDAITVSMTGPTNGYKTFETTITLADSYKDEWNDGNTKTVSFGGLLKSKNWDNAFKDGEITLGGDWAELTKSGKNNNKITSDSDLAGKKIKISLRSTPTKMECKAEIVE